MVQLNIQAIKTPTVITKGIHTVLGAVSLGIVGYYSSSARNPEDFLSPGVVILANETFFYLLTTFAFLITSFLLLVSNLFDDNAEKIGKSLFEVAYHSLGTIFTFVAAICHFVTLAKIPSEMRIYISGTYALLVIAGICALLNSIAYAANAVIAVRLMSQNAGNGLNRGGIVFAPQSAPTVQYAQSVTTAPQVQSHSNPPGYNQAYTTAP